MPSALTNMADTENSPWGFKNPGSKLMVHMGSGILTKQSVYEPVVGHLLRSYGIS